MYFYSGMFFFFFLNHFVLLSLLDREIGIQVVRNRELERG